MNGIEGWVGDGIEGWVGGWDRGVGGCTVAANSPITNL